MKQKIIVISLFVLWLLQCGLPAIVYYSGRWQYHLENFSVNTTNKKIVTVTSPNNEKIKWEVKGKEFEMDGVLYDVISLSTNADGITITCYDDSKETQLKDGYHDYVKDKNNKNKTLNSVKKNIDKQLADNRMIFAPFKCLIIITTSVINNALETGNIDIDIPPPRNFS